MLGQLGMKVQECKDVYKNLAVRVFGNPRHFALGGFARNKYSAQALNDAIEQVLRERGLPRTLALNRNPPIFYRQANNVSFKIRL
jgi:hypothetical protein